MHAHISFREQNYLRFHHLLIVVPMSMVLINQTNQKEKRKNVIISCYKIFHEENILLFSFQVLKLQFKFFWMWTLESWDGCSISAVNFFSRLNAREQCCLSSEFTYVRTQLHLPYWIFKKRRSKFFFSSFIKFSFLGSSILKPGDTSEKEDSNRLGASDYIAIGEFFNLKNNLLFSLLLAWKERELRKERKEKKKDNWKERFSCAWKNIDTTISQIN
jgi:hypothetical protein